jgi:PAS domain S-box-containing protein
MRPSPSSPYETILDSIADGVFTVDKEWRITSFNRAAETITGVPRAEAVGRKCWEVFHADVCEHECVLKKTIESGRSIVNRTVHIVNGSGRTIPISISTALLKDAHGTITGGVETFRDLSEIEELRKEVLGRHTLGDIITRDHRLHDLLESLPAIAQSDTPVLIQGESGTGTELLAKTIHALSARAKGPFVAVNCGALPETLFESELFGYKKGAFTDAKSDKPGRFDRAKNGTLFFDEIGELPRSVQAKLLRVLQERVYEPLGATEPVASNVRIMAATNRDLGVMVASEEFRQDLYYRISVIPLTVPPLRERPVDLPVLVEHLIGHYNTVFRKSIKRLSQDAMALLMAHDFPGNVRELENVLQHAFVLCQGQSIEKKHLPASLLHKPSKSPAAPADLSVDAFEKNRIEQALARNRFNRVATAKELGMHVTTLWRKMKRLEIA